MTRPRVLCVSGDRSTRATVARAFGDDPVDVIVPSSSDAVLERIEHGDFDAVVIDASTVVDVPSLVDDVESQAATIPTFVHWTDDGADVTVPVETLERVDDRRVADLANAVVERLERGPDGDLEELVGIVERRLADAATPSAVERAIREPITDADRFRFAWVGEYDRGEGQIVPWVTDVGAVPWPIQRTFGVGDGEQPVIDRALHTRDMQVVEGFARNRDLVPLGEAAIERGSDAVAVAPLAAGGELYGVLVVYGSDGFADAERAAIDSLADTASYAIESIAVRGKLDQQGRALHRYERLVETAGDGMYVLDEDGHFTTVNEALLEMTGYRHEGLLGEPISLLFDADDDTVEALAAADADEDTVEARLETKGGETIPCEIQVAALARESDYRGSVGVVRDVTERKRRERKLERQNERLDAFARIVSHDLRNPLGVAQGYLDLLEETGSLEYARNVRDGLERMETIIADVLAITREGRTAVDEDQIDLATVATDAWANVTTSSASLEVEGTMEFRADRARLLRLFENLYRNSVEHGSTSSRPQADDSVEHGSTRSRGGSRPDDAVEQGSTSPRSQAHEDSVERSSTSSRPQADDSVEQSSTSSQDGPRPDDSVEHGSTSSPPRAEDSEREATIERGDTRPTDGEATRTVDGNEERTGSEGRDALTVRVGPLEGEATGFYVADDGNGLPDEIRAAFDSGESSLEEFGLGLWIVEEVARGHGWTARATASEDGGARFEFAVDD